MKKINIIIVTTDKINSKYKEILIKKKSLDNIYIGVERGAVYLSNNDIYQKFICGDWDSVSKEEFQQISLNITPKKIISLPINKDYLDLEIAIDFALKSISARKIQNIIVITDQNRFDMNLATINIAWKYRYKKIQFLVGDNILFFFKEKKINFNNLIFCKYKNLNKVKISLFALHKKTKLIIKNLKYEGTITIFKNNNNCVSNELKNIKKKTQLKADNYCLFILSYKKHKLI